MAGSVVPSARALFSRPPGVRKEPPCALPPALPGGAAKFHRWGVVAGNVLSWSPICKNSRERSSTNTVTDFPDASGRVNREPAAGTALSVPASCIRRHRCVSSCPSRHAVVPRRCRSRRGIRSRPQVRHEFVAWLELFYRRTEPYPRFFVQIVPFLHFSMTEKFRNDNYLRRFEWISKPLTR